MRETKQFYSDLFKKANTFAELIRKKLPRTYLFHEGDRAWLCVVAKYWDSKNEKKSILKAFKEAAKEFGYSVHIDPYELAIDAGICDSKLNIS